MALHAPPVIDFARKNRVSPHALISQGLKIQVAFFTGNAAAQAPLVEQIRQACEEFGFFQLCNHGVSTELQHRILEQSKDLFDLPAETKMKYNRGMHTGPVDCMLQC